MSSAVARGESIADLLATLTPDRRAELVRRLRGDRSASAFDPGWFIRHPAALGDARRRLICLSYAGSGASIFRDWSNGLPGDVEVVAVQLPGREHRVGQAAYRRLDAMIADLHAALRPLLDRPFALYGHSMGALVAFELARQLRRDGGPSPEQIFLSAFRAPHLPNPNIRIYHLPDEVLKTVLLKEGTPAEVLDNAELMAALLPTLRADFEVCDTYQFETEAALGIPMHVFGGLHDIRVSRTDLEPWQLHAGSNFTLQMLPGSHFFLHSERDLLLAALTEHLGQHQPTSLHEGEAVA